MLTDLINGVALILIGVFLNDWVIVVYGLILTMVLKIIS